MRVLRGLSDGDAGFDVSKGDVVTVVAVVSEGFEIENERGDDFIVWKLAGERIGSQLVWPGKVEVLWENANDLIGLSGDLDGLANHFGLTAEESFPEMGADDDDFFVA